MLFLCTFQACYIAKFLQRQKITNLNYSNNTKDVLHIVVWIHFLKLILGAFIIGISVSLGDINKPIVDIIAPTSATATDAHAIPKLQLYE